MATAEAIRLEIELLGVAEASPGMAAVAIELAKSFDGADAPTSRAAIARELSAVMVRLRANAPIQAEGDAVDDVAEQRKKRREEARKRQQSG